MDKEEIFAVAALVERNNARLRNQEAIYKTKYADYERQLTEHRASFGARTEADAKIIAGLREELNQVRNSLGIQAAKEANKVLGMVDGEGLRGAAERVVKERDGLLTQVQDMRAEMERLSAQLGWERAEIKRLQWENATMHKDAEDGYAEAIKVLGDPIALSKERDALRAEVAALKSQIPKHLVKVGEWVKRLKPFVFESGTIAKVLSINENDRPPTYTVEHIDGNEEFWFISNCEPCDPPTEATHDTPTGKQAAEAAVKTEPDEIKVGDVVEVFRSTNANWTRADEIGIKGTVQRFEMTGCTIPVVWLSNGGAYALQDVRKVTT